MALWRLFIWNLFKLLRLYFWICFIIHLNHYFASARVRGNDFIMGDDTDYEMVVGENFFDIAQRFKVPFTLLRLANPTIDPYAVIGVRRIIIPRATLWVWGQESEIIVNRPELRMFVSSQILGESTVLPVSIGGKGSSTPIGITYVTGVKVMPTWFPSGRLRSKHFWLQSAIEPGPDNPLGNHAIYLARQSILIHGTNDFLSIGRSVTLGCIRLYPDDAASLATAVNRNQKVRIIDQPIKVAVVNGVIYLQSFPEVEDLYLVESYVNIRLDVSRRLDRFRVQEVHNILGPSITDRFNKEIIRVISGRRGIVTSLGKM